MDVPALLSVLNDYGFEDTNTTRKVADIQAAIWDIEGRRAWPFLGQTINLAFSGSSGVPTNLPVDVRASKRMKNLAGGRITPIREDDLEDIIGTNYSMSDTPRVYYYEDGQWKLWPIPPSSTVVRWKYVRWSAAITEATVESGILIPKYFHESTIVPLTLSRLYARDDDPEMASYYGQVGENGIALMVDTVFRQQIDQPDFVRITDPDDFDFDF